MIALAAACLFATGCVPDAATGKHVTAFSEALAPVVDEASAAYHDVNAIHDLSVDYQAAYDFDKTDKVYHPKDTQPFLTDAQIDVRLAVLKGMQAYVKTLAAVTNGEESPALDAASKSLGHSLTDMANAQGPIVETGLGIVVAPASTTTTTVTTTSGSTTNSTTSTSTTPAPVVTPGAGNILSTGINALGQFLAGKKVKEELPGIVEKMDPVVKQLCEVLSQEADTMLSQENIDYDTVIDLQTEFLRTTKTLDPETRREQIMKLPAFVRQERISVQQLKQLKGGLLKLELTHHALAADVQGNNPESLKNKLGDLEAAGNNLGKFYSTLATSK